MAFICRSFSIGKYQKQGLGLCPCPNSARPRNALCCRSHKVHTGFDMTLAVKTSPTTETHPRWVSMALKFISKNVSVDGRNSIELREHIELTLSEEGDPVRWAVVEANEEEGTCRIDAVVSNCLESI